MARRKPDSEVGPRGVWAYNTRLELDLSVEQVIEQLPTLYHPATLRKIEGGSAQPGRRMWRELSDLYGRLANERGLQLASQPAHELPEALAEPDLVTAIRDQTRAINALVAQLETLVGPMGEALAGILTQQVREATGRRGSGAASSSGR